METVNNNSNLEQCKKYCLPIDSEFILFIYLFESQDKFVIHSIFSTNYFVSFYSLVLWTNLCFIEEKKMVLQNTSTLLVIGFGIERPQQKLIHPQQPLPHSVLPM